MFHPLERSKGKEVQSIPAVMKTLVFQQMYHEFPLQFAIVRCLELRTPHLPKNTFKFFGSLSRRYTAANGKFLYGEQPRPFSFTYREKKLKSVAHFARTGRLI